MSTQLVGRASLDRASDVQIVEVGPRDGLQSEAPVPLADRVRLVNALSATGLRRIETASFVHPEAVPAMASTSAPPAGAAARPVRDASAAS